jgi:hypothetical protein
MNKLRHAESQPRDEPRSHDGGAFSFRLGFVLPPSITALAVSPRFTFREERPVTLQCLNFARSCPQRVFRGARPQKKTFRRADFEQIGTGYFVVTFCALSLKSTRETARARKRTIPNIGLVTECLILLDKAALWC